MAPTARTKVTVTVALVLVNFVTRIQCENDMIRTQKHLMPIAEEPLLRSSEDHDDRTVEEENPDPANTAPDKTTPELDPNPSTNDVMETEAPSDVTLDKTDTTSTTETSQATEDSPEALGLVNDDAISDDDYKQHNIRRVDDDTTTLMPQIEETTKEETMATEVDVEQVSAEGNGDGDNNEPQKPTGEVESNPSNVTMPLTDEAEGAISRSSQQEEDDSHGQRNPKTGSSETNTQINARTYELTKQSPQPQISRSATLRGWLEDAWLRPPPGLLVPLRPTALHRALAVWGDMTSAGRLNVSDIVIIGYDRNGVNWRSRHNLLGNNPGGDRRAVTEVLSKLLRKYQDVNSNDVAGDGTMRALTSGAKLVPYDSALFVITDKGPADPQRLPLALRALIEKRLKVYTIWTDPHYPSTESEVSLQVLRNISAHTEGDVLPYSLQVMDTDLSNLEAENSQLGNLELPRARMAKLNSAVDDKLETLLVKRGGGGAISLGLPVETGVTALRVYIEGAVEHAVLYPPNDAPQIDLYNQTSVELFSAGSKTDSLSPRKIYLALNGGNTGDNMFTVLPMSSPSLLDAPAPTTAGVWHLSMRCDTCDYRLTVYAHAAIRFRTEQTDHDVLRLRVLGPVATVRESALVDEYGTELARLSFSYQPQAGDASDDLRLGDQEQELVAEVPLPDVKAARVYAKIVGRDVHGESFVRLSGPLNRKSETRVGRSVSISFPDVIDDLELAEEFSQMVYDNRRRYNESDVLPNNRASSQVVNQLGTLMTAVQIGLSSRIYGAPGNNLQLHFEVTNFRDQAVTFRFEAIGELRFLRGISPSSRTISSGETANVVVSVGITGSAQPGARDLITFTAYGLDQVSISTYVYVVNPAATVTDVWSPELRHNFQGTCVGKLGNDCAQHVWSATIIARDSVGGLLRLSSTPRGVLYEGNFIAGTREEVIATYRATCCDPRVLVTAVDAYGNANSYVVDISTYYTPAAIASIVLAVFLLIALIAIIVFLITWCVRRRKESRELPYTTSTRRDIS